MLELALVVPHSKTKTWAGKCLQTLQVVSKVAMAAILDLLVDSLKEAMLRQPYGRIVPYSSRQDEPITQ